MFAYIWPLAMVVFSNVMYQICARSMPSDIDPWASLTVTYLVSTIMCGIMFFVMRKNTTLMQEYGKLNWVPFVFGIVLVGLEVGWIYAYKAGWQVSVGSIVQSSFLSVALIIVGYLVFHETITWNKILGAAVCLAGLLIINLR